MRPSLGPHLWAGLLHETQSGDVNKTGAHRMNAPWGELMRKPLLTDPRSQQTPRLRFLQALCGHCWGCNPAPVSSLALQANSILCAFPWGRDPCLSQLLHGS